MNLWMNAFRKHQYYTMEGRINIFKRRLDLLDREDKEQEESKE